MIYGNIENKYIELKVECKKMATPDYININLKLKESNKTVEKAVYGLNQRVKKILEALEDIDTKKIIINCSDFDVRKDFMVEKNKIELLNAIQEITIGFDYDKKTLENILSKVVSSGANPEISFYQTIKDSTNIFDEVIEEAVQKSKHQAELICKASQMKLGALLRVDMESRDFSISSRCLSLSMPKSISCLTDIQPSNLEIKKELTFVWGME